MKRLIAIFFLCYHFLVNPALLLSADIDSLKRILPAMPHDSTRLKVILDITRREQITPNCISYSNMLFEEAIKQKNAKYAGTALYFQVIYYYNQNDLDSVNKKITEMEPFVQKGDLWNYYFDSQRCLIDLYSYREQYELAVNKALEMHQKAKEIGNIRGLIGANQCLGNAYMGTGRWEKGKQALEDAHKLLPQMNNMVVTTSVLSQLITLSKVNNENSNLKKYLDEQKKSLDDYLEKNPAMREAFMDPLIFNCVYYVYYYVNTKQPLQALEYLQNGEKCLRPHTFFMYKVLYHDAYAAYYRLCEKYNLALEQIDSTIVLLKNGNSGNYVNQLVSKADLLVEAKRCKEALPIYEEALIMKDSLAIEVYNKQMKLIQSNYHLDKMELEESRLRNRNQLIIFNIIAITLILLIIFTIRIYRVRRSLKVSELETRKATRIAEEANETKNHFLSNMSYNIRIPLNGVVGFSQLIASEPEMDEKTRQEFSAIIQKNSQELMQLVNDILDLSRLEADMMKFQIQEYDIVALCNDAICMARMQNEGAIEIQFKNNIESQNITTDTGRLTQVLVSTLIYPHKNNTHRKVLFTLTHDDVEKVIRIRITNSPLADPEFFSQEVEIRNEINRLLLMHFGGTYRVKTDEQGKSQIDLTYPLDGISG